MSFSEQKTHILIVENDSRTIEDLQQAFRAHNNQCELMVATSLEEARALLLAVVPDLSLINWHLPDGDGRELLPLIHANLLRATPVLAGRFRRKPLYPVIFLSSTGNEHLALDAMRAGALDYMIMSGDALRTMPQTVTHALREWDDLVLRDQAEEAMRTELARAELFYSTAYALVSLDRPKQKLQTIVDNVAEALPASLVVLHVLDLAKRQIMETVIGGLNTEPFTAPLFDDLWDGLIGWSLRKLEPVISPKNATDARERTQAREKRLNMQIGSLMITPLVCRGRTLGVMCAYNRLDERNFTRNNLNLLTAMAHQAAVVVEEARLVEEKQELIQQIQQQVNRIERILDSVPEGIIVLNSQRRVIQVNTLGREYLRFLGSADIGEILYSLNAIPIQTLLRLPAHAQHNKVQISLERQRYLEIYACPVHSNEGDGQQEETLEESAVGLGGAESASKEPDEWVIVVRDISAFKAMQQPEPTAPPPSLAHYATQLASTIVRSLRNDASS